MGRRQGTSVGLNVTRRAAADKTSSTGPGGGRPRVGLVRFDPVETPPRTVGRSPGVDRCRMSTALSPHTGPLGGRSPGGPATGDCARSIRPGVGLPTSTPPWRDTREQAYVPAEQPPPSQGARLPPAHAHPCRPRDPVLASPQGPQQPRRLRPDACAVPCLVLPAPHRLTSTPSPSRRGPPRAVARRSRTLVVHLLAPADRRASPSADARRVGFVVSRAVGQRRHPQPGQAPAAPPRAGSGSTSLPAALRARGPGAAGRGAASYEELAPSSTLPDRARCDSASAGDGEQPMKYLLIGLLRAYRFADQPALRPGLPLPPVLLGVRAGGGHACTAASRAAGSPSAGCGAATRGPRAATTPVPPRAARDHPIPTQGA